LKTTANVDTLLYLKDGDERAKDLPEGAEEVDPALVPKS